MPAELYARPGHTGGGWCATAHLAPPPRAPPPLPAPDATRRLPLKPASIVLSASSATGRCSLGRALIFSRITADVERVVLSSSQPGFADRLRATDSALLIDLVVVEEARRRGVGTRLVEDALEVRRDNQAALRIYRRLAFELDGEADVVWCSRSL
jgi:GNAT superfamily N-acetyltransferase